jgi:hypothetical protein
MVEEADSRCERRQRVLKGAAIINGINKSEISCTIRNQNVGGAKLKVPVEARVPEHSFCRCRPNAFPIGPCCAGTGRTMSVCSSPEQCPNRAFTMARISRRSAVSGSNGWRCVRPSTPQRKPRHSTAKWQGSSI